MEVPVTRVTPETQGSKTKYQQRRIRSKNEIV